MPRLPRFLLPILSFGLSKASVLFAPLLLAATIPLAAYGQLEANLAWAALVAPILAMGLPAAVPYFLLKEQKFSNKPLIACCATAIGGCVVLLQLGYFLLGVQPVAVSVMVIATVFSLQFVWSAFLKSESKPAIASMLDGGFYSLLMLFAVACLWLPLEKVLPWLDVLVWLYLLLLCGIGGFWLWQGRRLLHPPHVAHLRTLFRYCLPYVLPGLGMLAIINGGRIMAHYWLGSEAVGVYAFLFRLAAPAIVMHQLLATLFFKQLYIAPAVQLDRYFPVVIFAVLATGVMAVAMLPLFMHDHWSILSRLVDADWQVQRLLVVQVALWIAIALMEFVIARENKVWAQLLALIAVAIAGFVSAFWVHHAGRLDLLGLCQVQLAVFLAAYLAMWGILWRTGVRLPRSCAVVATMVAAYLLAEALIF